MAAISYISSIHYVSDHQVYSADRSTAQTHKVALSLLNPDKVILDQTEYRDEGEIKDIQVPTRGLHEICFDGR